MLVNDVLGRLIYCPSCFGMIPVGAGLIACPSCENGLRHDLRALPHTCSDIIKGLTREPVPAAGSDDSPPGVHWHLTRTDLLSRLFQADEINDTP